MHRGRSWRGSQRQQYVSSPPAATTTAVRVFNPVRLHIYSPPMQAAVDYPLRCHNTGNVLGALLDGFEQLCARARAKGMCQQWRFVFAEKQQAIS